MKFPKGEQHDCCGFSVRNPKVVYKGRQWRVDGVDRDVSVYSNKRENIVSETTLEVTQEYYPYKSKEISAEKVDDRS